MKASTFHLINFVFHFTHVFYRHNLRTRCVTHFLYQICIRSYCVAKRRRQTKKGVKVPCKAECDKMNGDRQTNTSTVQPNNNNQQWQKRHQNRIDGKKNSYISIVYWTCELNLVFEDARNLPYKTLYLALFIRLMLFDAMYRL